MALLGTYLTGLALPLAVYAALASGLGRGKLAASGRGAVLALALVNTGAVLTLLYLLVTSDFRVAYVVDHTARTLPLPYKLAALWGGDAGSLLLWVWILSLYAAYLALVPRQRELVPKVLGLLAGIASFFQLLLVAAAPPFALLPQAAADGVGLNPLLDNPMMLVHPPALYLGYVGMAIPFAYGVAALWARQRSADWLRLTRRWTVVAWLFLSVGIVLGGMWAYLELGWGGYWAWDPVENASFMPWLTATAFLHSALAQERRRVLRGWTFALLFTTFFLTIFGTFLTRSGLVSSVHAFSGTKVGPYFLAFFALLAAGLGVLLYLRRDVLAAQRSLEGTASRETAVALANLVLSAAAVVTLLGTLAPILSDIGSKQQVAVDPAFFNAAVVPLLLAVVVLMGAGQALRWKQAGRRRLMRLLIVPLGFALTTVTALVAVRVHQAAMLAAAFAAAFLLAGVASEFARATVARRKGRRESILRAAVGLLLSDRRRWGGYLVHAAVAVILVGVAASTLYTRQATVNLQPGQSMHLAGYALTYHGLDTRVNGRYIDVAAHLALANGSRALGTVTPREYFLPGTTTPYYAKVAIRGGWAKDLYIEMGWNPTEKGNQVAVRALAEPLVAWIWMGLYLLVAGAGFALSAPRRREA
ncbi:MAG: cytochrome c biogenesis protein CcsA [Thermaerobacter sp.]|nr:cytochrome c biogenesis protein CcsA [Thermaerobacter sp.]